MCDNERFVILTGGLQHCRLVGEEQRSSERDSGGALPEVLYASAGSALQRGGGRRRDQEAEERIVLSNGLQLLQGNPQRHLHVQPLKMKVTKKTHK